jgi:hypothetical protein
VLRRCDVTSTSMLWSKQTKVSLTWSRTAARRVGGQQHRPQNTTYAVDTCRQGSVCGRTEKSLVVKKFLLSTRTHVLAGFAADRVRYLELRTTPRTDPQTGMIKQDYLEAVLRAISDQRGGCSLNWGGTIISRRDKMCREKANLTVQGGGQRAGKLAQELSARNSLTIIVSVCQGHPNNNQITHHTAPIISLRTLPGVCSNGVWSLIKFALGAFRGRFYNSREEKKKRIPARLTNRTIKKGEAPQVKA